MYTCCIQVSRVCQAQEGIMGSRQAKRNINNHWNVAATKINIYLGLGSKQKTNKMLLTENKHETDFLTCVFVFLIRSYKKYFHFLWEEFPCQSVFMNMLAEDFGYSIYSWSNYSSLSIVFSAEKPQTGPKTQLIYDSHMKCLRDTLLTRSTSHSYHITVIRHNLCILHPVSLTHLSFPQISVLRLQQQASKPFLKLCCTHTAEVYLCVCVWESGQEVGRGLSGVEETNQSSIPEHVNHFFSLQTGADVLRVSIAARLSESCCKIKML